MDKFDFKSPAVADADVSAENGSTEIHLDAIWGS